MMLTSSITPYDLGAIGLIFLLAAGLLKLLAYVIKNRLENNNKEPCRALELGVCRLEYLQRQVQELHSVICSASALGRAADDRAMLCQTHAIVDEINKVFKDVK